MKNIKKAQRGMALFAVIVLLAVMTAAAAIALDESVRTSRSQGFIKTNEILKAGVEHGFNLAVQELENYDVTELANCTPSCTWDLFNDPLTAVDFLPVGPIDFPTMGPYAQQFTVRVGLTPGQRTRAPAGEDVRKAYGQVVDIQIMIQDKMTGSEERVEIGVMIPRRSAHSN